ncbi:ABC-2 type transport system permease protein [Amycolatopsis bartoniae]|uniref:Transport permease protein n=1 Tax=Amycolatopsis bartoniae TaxID=941986 RepID=A0A8H9IWD5_9PSEU|nr:ABC transporter permease [Amycolatopsis bartoniae]MBB2934306.1 ABC-2 type transport system permease protein [Amycolatopsis bartoniae]TVT00136.1 ABC transporter permease [Amycolatopsis bartoniae]GHF48320.1 transport permease protein [Amycolatopsis bartoniae]
MNVLVGAGRAGLVRGRIELRQTFTNTADLWSYLFPAVLLTAVMVFMRGSSVPGMNFQLSSLTLPGVLGMNVAFGGLVNLSQQLVTEREDGTLLRAKAVPNGMVGYLVGKIVQVSGMSLVACVLVLVPGLFVTGGLDLGAGSWLALLGVLVLGLVASMPLGAILGSLLPSTRSMGLVMLPIMGMVGLSGIFYPITSLPSWLQGVGQVFPIYWVGLGMRSALLPDALSAVEIGHSWRHLETVGMLGVWAVLGLLLAPVVLRRMARRESGSTVAARREKALQRMPR